jgi:predicted DNA-binding transcriptional regulator YafY
MKDRVLLEEIPLGQAFLDSILDAMQRNVELRIDYQSYERGQEEEHMQTFHFQPYALKVYNRRWYLLGYQKEKEALRLISLDRIHDLKKTSTHFELPSDFDARMYFADVVGVYVDKDKQVSNIKIRAYGVQAEYLRSTPLHRSQSEVRSKHGEFV